MLESLLPETRGIIRRAEKGTGVKVRLFPSENDYLGVTKLWHFLAHEKASEISITFNPDSKSIDYAIAHEVTGFLRYSQHLPRKDMHC